VFQLIHVGGSLSGTFDSVLLPAFSDSRFWQLTYSSHDVFLNVGSGVVPEPSDAILSALGVAALAIVRRLQSVKRGRRWQLLKHFATARHFLH
jgi:hypothetical protein